MYSANNFIEEISLVLLEESENEFINSWNIIKKKISDYSKNIKTKQDAVEFIVLLYKKTKSLPYSFKQKIIKYSIILLSVTFGFNNILMSVPQEIKKIINQPFADSTLNSQNTDTIQLNDLNKIYKASNEIKDFIKQEEGFSLTVYEIKGKNGKSDGMVTVGWGHAEIKGKSSLRKGDKISMEKAIDFFEKDIKNAEEGLNRILNNWEQNGIKVEINQQMYDAMVSMIFNMGISKFRKTEFIQLVKRNELKKAKQEILITNANYPGLKERRKRESFLFGKGIAIQNSAHLIRNIIKEEVSLFLKMKQFTNKTNFKFF